jgi:UDP-glucose 4-epimerase
MKCIVTGGAGFIGSHLVDLLLEHNHEVVVLDNFSTGRPQNLDHVRDRITLLECDLAVKGSWESAFKKADYVFHLAALADIVPSIQNPEAYYYANVNGTLNVLQACQGNKLQKFIYAASSSCYGIPDSYPTSEEADIRPQYPYALTKRMGEELSLHWAQVYKLPVISTRFFNVYGPRSRTSGTYGAVFGVFLAQKLAGLPYTVVGDGEQTRDFTYVKDVVSAIYACGVSDKTNRVYNIGSGKTVSVNRIIELLGGDKVFIPKRPGEPDCTFADISRIRGEIGWSPEVSIETGVIELLKHINYWKEAPVWTTEKIAHATTDWFKYLGD